MFYIITPFKYRDRLIKKWAVRIAIFVYIGEIIACAIIHFNVKESSA